MRKSSNISYSLLLQRGSDRLGQPHHLARVSRGEIADAHVRLFYLIPQVYDLMQGHQLGDPTILLTDTVCCA